MKDLAGTTISAIGKAVGEADRLDGAIDVFEVSIGEVDRARISPQGDAVLS